MQRIPIQNQIPLPAQKAILHVEQIASHLLHPSPLDIAPDPCDLHHPAPDIDQRKMVSGEASVATLARSLRPSWWPSTASRFCK